MSATTKRDAAARAAALANAWGKFDTARAALAVWVLALPRDGVNTDNVDHLQVAMLGICELLSEAREGFDDLSGISDPAGMAPLFACSFASVAESALWNYMDSGAAAAAPAVADLAATARQVLAYLADIERHRGATRPCVAAPAAVVEGGAA